MSIVEQWGSNLNARSENEASRVRIPLTFSNAYISRNYDAVKKK